MEKLKLTAFTKPERTGTGEIFLFSVNPEGFSSQYTNRFSRKRGINTSGRNADYALSDSKELTLQLTLDNTFIRDLLPGIPFPSKGSVKKQVDKFVKYCVNMDGKIHEPRFLLIEWGSFSVKCRLKSVKVSYTLFDEQGEPRRAKLDTVFVEDMTDELRLRLENKESPDITHYRTVLQGQTLSGLSKEIYGDASHYLMLAKANNLDHFRALEPGSQMYFPPLEK